MFTTWDITTIVLFVIFIFGFLRQRMLNKYKRHVRGEPERAAKQLLLQASPYLSPDKSPYVSAHTFAPFHESSSLEDSYMKAAIGMESNQQDFYRQAWEASRV